MFETKDSGEREQYASGMVRDSAKKTNYLRCVDGPLLEAWEVFSQDSRVEGDDPEEWRKGAASSMHQWLKTGKEEFALECISFMAEIIEEDSGHACFEDGDDSPHPLDTILFRRWAELLVRGAEKYNDVAPGVPNWTLANGTEEYHRFRVSAYRHFYQWFIGDTDEDHAAAVLFNVNGALYVQEKLPQTDAKAEKLCEKVFDAVQAEAFPKKQYEEHAAAFDDHLYGSYEVAPVSRWSKWWLAVKLFLAFKRRF